MSDQSNEWKQLNRELKILRAKNSASKGRMSPKDRERLAWLEERIGEGKKEERIELKEERTLGPSVKTSDDHYATEMSAELLKKAERYKAQKQYERDDLSRQARFEAKDSREGRQTFQQKGLSPFAIDLTADLKREGFAEEPVEEKEVAKKVTIGRVNIVKDETELLTKKSEEGGNPFALDLDDGLAKALKKFRDPFKDSAVPKDGAKAIRADYAEKILDKNDEGPAKIDAVPDELQSLIRKSYQLPKGKKKVGEEAKSIGEATTHEVKDSELTNEVDLKLMRDALTYAERKRMVEDAGEIWTVDEEGNELAREKIGGSLEGVFDTAGPALPPGRAKLDDARPGGAGDDSLGVLIPPAPPQETAAQSCGHSAPAAVLIPDPPPETSADDGEDTYVPDMSDDPESEVDLAMAAVMEELVGRRQAHSLEIGPAVTKRPEKPARPRPRPATAACASASAGAEPAAGRTRARPAGARSHGRGIRALHPQVPGGDGGRTGCLLGPVRGPLRGFDSHPGRRLQHRWMSAPRRPPRILCPRWWTTGRNRHPLWWKSRAPDRRWAAPPCRPSAARARPPAGGCRP